MDYSSRNSHKVLPPSASSNNRGMVVPNNSMFMYSNNTTRRHDLSLIATGLHCSTTPSTPSPLHPATTTTDRSSTRGNLRLSQSDSKAVQIMMMNKRDKTLQRRSSEEIFSNTHNSSTTTSQFMKAPLVPPPAAMRPPSSRLIKALGKPVADPFTSPPLPSLILPPIIQPTLNNELYTIEQESTTTDNEDILTGEEEGESGDNDTSDSLISEEDEEDEHLISGVGFKDDTYTSETALNEVDFPQLSSNSPPTNKDHLIPATLLMEHYLTTHQSKSQGMGPYGHNVRVNNIVRAFELKGPLDKELLQQALNKVVDNHRVLLASFIVTMDGKYFWDTNSQGTINIEQSISYERPTELITLARRKLFNVQLKQSLHKTAATKTDGIGNCHDDDHLSIVSYKEESSPKLRHKKVHLQPLTSSLINNNNNSDNSSNLMFAKLVAKSPHEHILILSFSEIVCDFWSSCLFVQQLVDAYGKLEKSSNYKPSLAVLRQNKTRQEIFNTIESRRSKAGLSRPSPSLSLSPLSSRNLPTLQQHGSVLGKNKELELRCPPRAFFEQVCLRERQILVVKPNEKLWNFWESNVTSTIKRIRGPPRVKVIPPLRIPSGYGEMVWTLARPTTSRLRPLTAARQRPPTAKRSSEKLVGESLSGPTTGTVYLKVNEKIGSDIVNNFPEEYLSKIDRKELLGLVTLSAYVLLLGKCCRGWDGDKVTTTTSRNKEGSGLLQATTSTTTQDPLLKYNQGARKELLTIPTSSTSNVYHHGGSSSDVKKRGCKLDVGSFLIGVDVSLRQLAPETCQGLLGPLTNTVGLRVDLSSYTSFADMVHSIWSTLHRCRSHGHFPFSTIADELGLVHGLPVKFSYYNTYDVQQLSNPEGFYFMETSVGVADHKALARMGSCCYINPLNSKKDDSCQLELFVWEGVKVDTIEGLLNFQTKLLRHDIVQSFSEELIKILKSISTRPLVSVSELAANIHPPFVNTGLRERKR